MAVARAKSRRLALLDLVEETSLVQKSWMPTFSTTTHPPYSLLKIWGLLAERKVSP
jgi:hypothetical protein